MRPKRFVASMARSYNTDRALLQEAAMRPKRFVASMARSRNKP